MQTRGALIENLYCDLLVLTDEARAGVAEAQQSADKLTRVQTACASLHLTTHLLKLLHWLLDIRSIHASAHMSGVSGAVGQPHSVPPPMPVWDIPVLPYLPEQLTRQLEAAQRFHERAERQLCRATTESADPPPHRLFKALNDHFG